MILNEHVKFLAEVLSLPGFLSDPVLTFGFQTMRAPVLVHGRVCASLGDLLLTIGATKVVTMDWFDPRADLRFDMNDPVPESQFEQYGTLIDIGSVEHVFDTRQCLENCMRMVRPGGHYFIHTPVNGYHGHGLHVFNPELICGALDVNGFDVVHVRFTTMAGGLVTDPSVPGDVLIWAVGRKRASLQKFICPQQGGWRQEYENVSRRVRRESNAPAPDPRALSEPANPASFPRAQE